MKTAEEWWVGSGLSEYRLKLIRAIQADAREELESILKQAILEEGQCVNQDDENRICLCWWHRGIGALETPPKPKGNA